MGNQTLSSGTVNYDDGAISGLLNGETITIQGGAVLVINSDVRWGQQAAVLGNVSVTEGEMKIDATETWWAPFSASSGNVPALGTVGTQDVTRGGTNVGEFLGVFTALGTAPVAAGSAMPGSGFVKLRRKTATFANADVLTFTGGATATLSGAGQRGWLHIVGAEGTSTTTGLVSIPRLGKLTVAGDWFELGTCNGSAGQTFQYFVADFCPGIQIETAAGSGVYEWWGNCPSGNFTSSVLGTDARSEFFTCSSAGVITIGGSTHGQLPPNGAKVRVPNVHLSSSTSANWAANTFNTTATANRYAFVSTGGDIDMQFMALNGSVGASNCNLASFKNCSGSDGAFIDNSTAVSSYGGCAEVYFENCQIAQMSTTTTNGGFLIGYAGKVTVKDCAGFRTAGGSTGTLLLGANNCAEVNVTGGFFYSKATVSQVGFTGSSQVTIDGTTFVLTTANNGVTFDGCTDVRVLSPRVSCKFISGDVTPNSFFSFIACRDWVVDDVAFFVGTDVPTLQFVSATEQSVNGRVRDIGARASPIDLASAGRRIVSLTNCRRVFVSRVYSANGSQGIDNPVLVANCDEVIVSDAGNPQAYSDNSVIAAPCNTLVVKRIASGGAKAYSTSPADGSTPSQPGASFGTHFFEQEVSATEVWLTINCGTEKSASDYSVDAYTVDVGTPLSDGSNGLLLRTLNDQVTWTWTYRIRGLTAFANTAPILSGTNTGNMSFSYDLDKGIGFSGTLKALTAANLSAETGITPAGVTLRVRAICTTANSANVLRSISVVGVTSASDVTANPYPYNEPLVSFTGMQSGSVAAIFRDSDGVLLATAAPARPRMYPGWWEDAAVTLRVRKPGWQEVSTPFTLTEDGAAFPLNQIDAATISDSNPGALSITVTDHGASPVTWNGKAFSITVTAPVGTSAATVAQWLSWQTAQDSYSLGAGVHNLAWPVMVVAVGTALETQRGALFGSAGAALKGVRVIDTTGAEIPGFARMQADDGSYYSPAASYTLTVSGIVSGSRILLRRTDTLVVLANQTVTGGAFSYTYTHTTDIPVEIVVRKATGSPAYQEWRTTTTLSASNNSQTANQQPDE